MSGSEALNLLKKNLKNQNLIKHSLAVEAGMRELAKFFGQDEEKWGICGLLHDIDYEIHAIESKTKMAKALFCLDPLTGLIVAATLVLPSKKIQDYLGISPRKICLSSL